MGGGTGERTALIAHHRAATGLSRQYFLACHNRSNAAYGISQPASACQDGPHHRGHKRDPRKVSPAVPQPLPSHWPDRTASSLFSKHYLVDWNSGASAPAYLRRRSKGSEPPYKVPQFQTRQPARHKVPPAHLGAFRQPEHAPFPSLISVKKASLACARSPDRDVRRRTGTL